MRAPLRTVLPAILVLALAASACGDSSPTDSDDLERTTSVEVRDSFFSPSANLVDQGAEVTWNWVNTSLGHNIIWVDADLENAGTRQFGSHTVTMPDEPGEYRYYCSLHGSPTSGMRGRVIVE